MPHLRNHKRRHSWPYCGSSLHLQDRQNIPLITVTEAPDDTLDFDLKSQFLTPVITEEDLDDEDDATSAGIIRTESHSNNRIWYHSNNEIEIDENNNRKQKTNPGSLRKRMQPPLDRARSLFILPSATSVRDRETVLLPYWIHRLSAHPISPARSERERERERERDRERGRSREDERGRLAAMKNHRRCHSERPRAWKQPSEHLWTLEEE
ncbi:hypothetical protein BJX99DRAFT_257514 [Aspergillus californicus]